MRDALILYKTNIVHGSQCSSVQKELMVPGSQQSRFSILITMKGKS